MIIRIAQDFDYLQWLHMRQLLWPDCAIEDHRNEMQMWLSDLQHFPVFIAEYENEVIGFLEASLYEQQPGVASSSVVYLEGWYVKEGHRRKGVGRRLVECAEEWAKAKRMKHLLSDTEIFNNISVHAHQQIGFKELRRTSAEIVFTKELA
jgi:aminoglycoside 6'-N-acetyltransferase I